MNLPTELFGDVLVVHTPEELGADHAERFEAFLSHLEQNHIVLDIDNTELLDSGGLTAFLNAQDRLHELDGDLKVATNNVVNRKILEITRLDQHLEVYDSVVDAVNSFH